MSAVSSRWELWLHGPVQLVGVGGPVRLERRAAALLAYLALEGPTPRSRLAGTLWPESPEPTARGNLRQLLLRLRRAIGFEPVVGGDVLSLAPQILASNSSTSSGSGRPLDGLYFADAESLNEWIDRARDALIDQRRRQLFEVHEEREAAGDLAAAIDAARKAVDLDPYSEEAHRRLMRSHALRGDRAAALAAYEACRLLLQQAFGADPSEQTRELARELARVPSPKRSMTPVPSPIPLAVLRPPLFVGRKREWALMEEAWSAGKGILLTGPAGSGKSRLMHEFLAHQGGALTFNGRPGERAIPYGTHARTYRELLEAISPVELPEWVRAELARIVPMLGAPAPPLQDAADKLRFFQAKLELHRIAHARGFDTLGFDDVQHVDPASAEAGHYILAQLQQERSTRVRTVHCFTAGTLEPELEARLRDAGTAQQFALVELEPLSEPELQSLLWSLELPELSELGLRRISRRAKGSPAVALESVKALLRGEPAISVQLHAMAPHKQGATARL